MTEAFDLFKTSLDGMRDKARFFVTQRRKDIELYALLADCLALCEEAVRGNFVEQIRQQVLARSSGRKVGRCYFEQGADPALVIGRYVFDEDRKNRVNSWRYVVALREASKQGIGSGALVDWLRGHGGINTLFKRREVEARSVRTKTLHLNQQVECPKGAPFTITLLRDERGFFDVITEGAGA